MGASRLEHFEVFEVLERQCKFFELLERQCKFFERFEAQDEGFVHARELRRSQILVQRGRAALEGIQELEQIPELVLELPDKTRLRQEDVLGQSSVFQRKLLFEWRQ